MGFIPVDSEVYHRSNVHRPCKSFDRFRSARIRRYKGTDNESCNHCLRYRRRNHFRAKLMGDIEPVRKPAEFRSRHQIPGTREYLIRLICIHSYSRNYTENQIDPRRYRIRFHAINRMTTTEFVKIYLNFVQF